MKRFLKNFICYLMIFGGISLYSYPIINTGYQQHFTKRYISKYESEWKKETEKKDSLLEEIKGYNEKIFQDGQKDFCDAWSYMQSPISFREINNDEFGYIHIPAMKVTLPLYLGASDEHLRKGAAILGQTSVPIGGKNSNSVIAGHRGYHGIPFFREIETLSPGDKVIIKNPWKKLTYYVESCAVIQPYDKDAVKIEPGKDRITLITCHPYRSHGKYRYVVYCSRKQQKNEEKKMIEKDTRFESSVPDIKRENALRKICAVILAMGILITAWNLRKRRKKMG